MEDARTELSQLREDARQHRELKSLSTFPDGPKDVEELLHDNKILRQEANDVYKMLESRTLNLPKHYLPESQGGSLHNQERLLLVSLIARQDRKPAVNERDISKLNEQVAMLKVAAALPGDNKVDESGQVQSRDHHQVSSLSKSVTLLLVSEAATWNRIFYTY